MLYQLHRTQQLNCDEQTAWDFFSSPHNLSAITPAEMRFSIKNGVKGDHIFPGMKINYKVSPLFSIPLNWQTIITQVDERRSFTDVQNKGPYKVWRHFHEFVPNEKGVLMKDTVSYSLPFGFIGKLVHSLLVKKKLRKIFDYRYRVIETLFNG